MITPASPSRTPSPARRWSSARRAQTRTASRSSSRRTSSRTAPSRPRTCTRPRRSASRCSRASSSFASARRRSSRGPETVCVPAGTAHRFKNIGDETAHFVCEVRPALGFEQLIDTMFTLAGDGKVNKGPAEPTASGRHRQAPLRRRSPALPAGVAPAARSRVRCAARPAARLPRHLRGRRAQVPDRPRPVTTTLPKENRK